MQQLYRCSQWLLQHGMPSSGWLSALTRHFSRVPLPSATPTVPAHRGRAGDNGIATVSSKHLHYPRKEGEDGPPSRPTTPWSLDTLDREIRHAHHHNHQPAPAPTTTTPDLHHPPPSLRHHAKGPGAGQWAVMEAASRPHSATSASSRRSLPSSGASRPASAASRLSVSGPLLRSQTLAHTHTHAAHPLPAQVEDGEAWDGARTHYYIPPVIPPLYDRPQPAPTPASTRCNTPLWDLDGEKRVRFLEPEVVGEELSRPPSVNSQYSHVIKNSTRFAFHPTQTVVEEPASHNPRFCNCPCHFFPLGRRSVGVQVKRGLEQEPPMPPRPRHYRLFLTPSTRGLDHAPLASKSLTLLARALLSQVGLVVVVVAWWLAGAAIFSTVEGAAESETVNKMDSLRTDLVLGLATELRQVLPYDVVWRTKIEEYMGRLETAVLDAARAGYASRAPTWTMAGALLYSASLTTLVGPGGMTLRTGFSRVFAVLFSLVGAPLVLLLAVSGAFTIREGVGRAWAWRCGRGQQGRVSAGSDSGGGVEGRAGQYNSGVVGVPTAGSTLNLASRPHSSTSASGHPPQQPPIPNGPWELPGSAEPPRSARPRGPGELPQPSRVPDLESTLEPTSVPPTTPRDPEPSSSSQSAVPISEQYRTMGGEHSEGAAGSIVLPGRGKVGGQTVDQVRLGGRRIPKSGPPWPVYLALLAAYVLLGLAVFAPIQRWSLPSSLYIVVSTLLTLDHDSLGEQQASPIVVPYVVYMLLGLVLVAAALTSVWASLTAALVNTGKYLVVVRPTPR